jgi:hypothetical protein
MQPHYKNAQEAIENLTGETDDAKPPDRNIVEIFRMTGAQYAYRLPFHFRGPSLNSW